MCDEDGSERWTCCGLEIGRPILRDEDGLDSEQFELTPQRWRTIADNFDRYRLMAERRLIPTPENLERAGRIRRAMRRKPGEPWTDEALALLATEYQALEGTRGRNWMLAQRLGISRSNLQRALATAKRKGLMQSRVGI